MPGEERNQGVSPELFDPLPAKISPTISAFYLVFIVGRQVERVEYHVIT